MTQAPDRERVRERVVAPGVTRRPRPEATPPPQRFDKAAWGKAVMVLNVALIGGVAIVGLTHVRDADRPDAASGQPSGVASTLVSPEESAESAVPSGTAGEPAPAQVPVAVTPAPAVPAVGAAPKVRATMRSDFAAGDYWPVGAGFRENGSLAWPLGVVDRLLTHGPAQGADAVSWLEKWMKTDVRTIGARVLFAPNHSGSAAMTAWHTSILDETGARTPRTGMRLVMTPGQWRLVAVDGRGVATVATGSWVQQGRSAELSLVRKDDTVWVTAPDGSTTPVTDPRIASLSGPWASWELREESPGKRPAGFQEIWAG